MLRLLSLIVLLMLARGVARAADAEAELYNQASKAFADKFYERAEQQFAEFVAKFPGSTNVPMGILLQGQARFFQRRYEAAAELLRENLTKAGSRAAEFTFWTGEALREMERYGAAADQYQKVVTEHPDSPLVLQASYLRAFCAFELKDYARTIGLLQNVNETFQNRAKERPTDPYALRGQLLLGDALLATGRPEQARSVFLSITPAEDQPELLWERSLLLARLELAGTNAVAALPQITNAVSAARIARKPLLEAQTRNLEADVYRKLNRNAEAVASYEKVGVIEGLPIDQKRLALLKTVELLSTSGETTNALVRLESYLGAHTDEPAADLLKIKAGELWIDRFRELSSNRLATNALAQARSHLMTVLAQYTNSPHLGRASLNLGWSYWMEGTTWDRPARIQDSEDAFRSAAEKLTRSDDQALAYFKIADAEFFLQQPHAARSNYLIVVRNYTDLPQVRNALLDKAYRQLVRSSIELKDYPAAKQYLGELRAAFPNNPLTEETLFLYGQALGNDGRAAEARAVFEDFLATFPESALAPEVRYAEARAYATDGDFAAALKKHDEWLRAFTNNTLRPQVEFRRAALFDKVGQRTNALSLFTQFATKFPTNSLAPAAQTWVADFFYEQEQWRTAEQNYQRVFQNTNWATSTLAYQSRLMAAKTAFKRQAYNDARSYLTNLINILSADAKAPADLRAEAYFVLGDVFLEEPIAGSTNSLQNFIEAAKAFDHVATEYPSNKLAVLALGKKGDCHLQLSSSPAYAQSFSDATNAYLAVLNSRLPGIPVSARNQAQVGMGLVLKNLAETKPGAERQRLQQVALDRFLDVVYERNGNERTDPHYLKVAGLEAGRLAEALGNTAAALELYRRLSNEVPSLRTFWETRIHALQQRIASTNVK